MARYVGRWYLCGIPSGRKWLAKLRNGTSAVCCSVLIDIVYSCLYCEQVFGDQTLQINIAKKRADRQTPAKNELDRNANRVAQSPSAQCNGVLSTRLLSSI